MRGLVTYYIHFFIHPHNRRVHIAGMTPSPDGRWMSKMARNMSVIQDEKPEARPTHIVLDRDTKFTEEFCSVLETDVIEFRLIPPGSPNLNPYAESWIRRTKAECLNHFIVFGEDHLRHILDARLVRNSFQRPHQGLGNVPIMGDLPTPLPVDQFRLDDVICHESHGGLLKHYERRAA